MENCETCGATGQIGDGIHKLAGLGFGPGQDDRAIHLCDGCLERRETDAWPLSGPDGQRLYEALQDKTQAPSRRYSYLLEPDENIHLVRLRPDWVDRHAEA